MAATFCVVALTGCNHTSTPPADELLAEATEALRDNDYGHMQTICNHAADYVERNDTAAISESQAARLAILYMMLSDHRNEDENMAVATKCIQYAYSHSADSLRSFAATLPLDEQRHFELLKHLVVSIENPVDLMGEEFLTADTAMIYDCHH